MATYKWQKVADSKTEFDDLFQFNHIQQFMVFGKNVCVIKNEFGVFAFNEKCPHNGASLLNGKCNDKNEIICPMHRYPFNLQTGKATSGLSLSLECYPISITENGVFIGTKASWWES